MNHRAGTDSGRFQNVVNGKLFDKGRWDRKHYPADLPGSPKEETISFRQTISNETMVL